MRMKDLVANQRVASKALRASYAETKLQLNAARNAFRESYRAQLLALAKKQEEEKIALRRKHHNARMEAKAEKAYLAKSKTEADFWNYYPNHDGRRDTMKAVLQSRDMPVEKLDELMPAYADWLLTANKVHENGRPMNRWALMTAFVQTRLAAPGEVKRMLKPESVIVQMLIERGDLVVGHTVPRV
jgi:hypothetical protein